MLSKNRFFLIFTILIMISSCSLKGRAPEEGAKWIGRNSVKVWEETIKIPTYGIGSPDKNPMFLEARVYQGSSGVIYPHPVIDKVGDTKEDKEWNVIFMENKWVKIMIMPELGGRMQMAVDKTNGYNFIYYNRVIKPALVGLAGPWISGGLEFNWPQHHRPSTFEKQDYRIQKFDDGSVTVWCGEIEKMFRTQGYHGFTLYPDKSYVEIKARVNNRSDAPQTFLWWANPAVHVNDDYRSIFPPDVTAVMDHGKRAVSDFPIATGEYYKVDYSPGTDISMYKNIPVPTSFMAHKSDFNFIGCYDHGKKGGMLHVANHYVVPGKKQWTWGTSDFGQAWDRQLTDEDGPYIELMCGAFTDNQPDFSWLLPGEEKQFEQYFMPYRDIEGIKNATKEAAVNMTFEGGKVKIGVYSTSTATLRTVVTCKGNEIFSKKAKLDPATTLTESLDIVSGAVDTDYCIKVFNKDNLLVEYTPLASVEAAKPEPATAAADPQDIKSLDELFLNGLHLEQYRHANYKPEDYYLEALRRDSGDYRCNNAMGLLNYRRGNFEAADEYFNKAISRLTLRNPNPYDGEAFYNRGLALKAVGDFDSAYESFYKAVWNYQWQSAGYLQIAMIDARRGDFDAALDHLDKSLATNIYNAKAIQLKAAVLRKKGMKSEAIKLIDQTFKKMPAEFGSLYEEKIVKGGKRFDKLSRKDNSSLQEIALVYQDAGFFEEAIAVLSESDAPDPLSLYYMADSYMQLGDNDSAAKFYKMAASADKSYCFPNQLEAVEVLKSAMAFDSNDSSAPYYLGLYYYAHNRQADAAAVWEKSRAIDAEYATVWRNLALFYYNKKSDKVKAQSFLEKAFELNKSDSRVFFELDQLYKKLNFSPEKRIAFLEKYPQLVFDRYDQTVEYITLLNMTGRNAEALKLLEEKIFHPWEGGEGRVTGQYVLSLVTLGVEAIMAKEYKVAIEYLQRALTYPHNLGEGKLYGAQENNIFYFLGEAYAGLGDKAKSVEFYEKAATGLTNLGSTMYYNDKPPEMIFYQGLARIRLGRANEATRIFDTFINFGKTHQNDVIKMDYFAVSLPDFMVFSDDLSRRNTQHCYFMQALGYLGKKDYASAKIFFDKYASNDKNNFMVNFHDKYSKKIF
ncbi:MAG: DUF5107 domain-containing protein [Spirochaetales bacterium]|nr:DUF5107 domain-containing protein [Spirochaetales bacterium]